MSKISLSHTVWEYKYHMVWVPKKRRKIVYAKLRKEIGDILRSLSEYKGVEVIEGKACIDHIHVYAKRSGSPLISDYKQKKSLGYT